MAGGTSRRWDCANDSGSGRVVVVVVVVVVRRVRMATGTRADWLRSLWFWVEAEQNVRNIL